MDTHLQDFPAALYRLLAYNADVCRLITQIHSFRIPGIFDIDPLPVVNGCIPAGQHLFIFREIIFGSGLPAFKAKSVSAENMSVLPGYGLYFHTKPVVSPLEDPLAIQCQFRSVKTVFLSFRVGFHKSVVVVVAYLHLNIIGFRNILCMKVKRIGSVAENPVLIDIKPDPSAVFIPVLKTIKVIDFAKAILKVLILIVINIVECRLRLKVCPSTRKSPDRDLWFIHTIAGFIWFCARSIQNVAVRICQLQHILIIGKPPFHIIAVAEAVKIVSAVADRDRDRPFLSDLDLVDPVRCDLKIFVQQQSINCSGCQLCPAVLPVVNCHLHSDSISKRLRGGIRNTGKLQCRRRIISDSPFDVVVKSCIPSVDTLYNLPFILESAAHSRAVRIAKYMRIQHDFLSGAYDRLSVPGHQVDPVLFILAFCHGIL